MARALLTRIGSIAIKAEEAPGTYQADIADTDCFLAYDIVITPEIPMFKRDPFREYLSRDKSIPGQQGVTATFRIELKGSGQGTEPPDWDEVPRECGLLRSTGVDYTQYTPVLPEQLARAASLDIRLDGVGYQISGAVGNVRIVGRVGEPMFMECTFRGKLEDVVTAATLTPSGLDDIVPPVLLSASFATNIGGSQSHLISEIEFDMQNEIVLRPSVNEPEGIYVAQIIGRNPIGSFDPELVDEATYNWWDHLIAKSSDTGTLTLTCGSVQGNIIEITAPAIRLLGMEPLDREGIRCLRIPFEMNASAGNDEIQIKLRHTAA